MTSSASCFTAGTMMLCCRDPSEMLNALGRSCRGCQKATYAPSRYGTSRCAMPARQSYPDAGVESLGFWQEGLVYLIVLKLLCCCCCRCRCCWWCADCAACAEEVCDAGGRGAVRAVQRQARRQVCRAGRGARGPGGVVTRDSTNSKGGG